MKKPWICYGTKDIRHPLTENYSDSCSLPSCPNRRPFFHRVKPWLPWATSIGGVMLGVAIVASLIPKPEPLLFLHILDRSASAVNDSAFSQGLQQTCDVIADVSSRNFDSSFHLLVDSISESPYDRKTIESKRDFRQECQEKFKIRQDANLNTYVCPAWEKAISEIDSLPSATRPIVITQIHSNESETFCNQTLESLSAKIANTSGFHLIIGSTNEGYIGKGFNSKLRSFIDSSTDSEVKFRTKFIESLNPQGCFKKIVKSVRFNEQLEKPIQC